ncbi:hypothetical protein [Streptomyces sp. 2A115]|uniref:hypothetical protein n=1 Tax=Streptomyces sp. 2A115 TaxID=3457439 RepID=UPI003FD6BADF
MTDDDHLDFRGGTFSGPFRGVQVNEYTGVPNSFRRLGIVVGVACTTYAIFIIATLLTASSTGSERLQGDTEKLPVAWIVGILALSSFVLLAVGVPWLITRRQYMKNQNARFAEALKAQKEYERNIIEKLKKATELATLMELNQGQIGTYHRIVTEQADKAFKSSRVAMGVGLFLLVCAAFGGVYVPLEEIRWFIGALAAFTTLLSGYLTKTYLAMYKESVGQLNRYFDQPVLNSYYLTAERLAESLDAERATEVRQQIINEVLATSSRMGGRSAGPTEVKPPKAVLKGGKPSKRRPKKQTSSRNRDQA